MRYQAPAIEGREAVGGPLIRTIVPGSEPVGPSPAWKRVDGEGPDRTA